MTIAILLIATYSEAQVTGVFTDSRDGKTYKTVIIGTQTWMAQNLAYNTGSDCWAPENNANHVSTHGYLYTWEKAIKICPSGWHLPCDAEWTTLANYLGGWQFAGRKLKEAGTTHWGPQNLEATNESGFTAIGSGKRDFKGMFYDAMSYGNWWSATQGGFGAHYWILYYQSSTFNTGDLSKLMGISVRCIMVK